MAKTRVVVHKKRNFRMKLNESVPKFHETEIISFNYNKKNVTQKISEVFKLAL